MTSSPCITDDSHTIKRAGKPTTLTTLVKLPTFAATPYAVHAHVPVFETSGLTIAVLFCTTASTHQAIGLILTPCHIQSDPSRPLYHPGTRLGINGDGSSSHFRICMLSAAFHAPRFTASSSTWKDVYITHIPPGRMDVAPVVLGKMVNSLSVPFRVLRWEIERLQERGIFLDDALTKVDGSTDTLPRSTTTLVFRRHIALAGSHEYLEVLLGQCQPTGVHWAAVQFHGVAHPDTSHSFVHSCTDDHVSGWVDNSRTFEDLMHGPADQRCGAITLSLPPCPFNPSRTRVVEIAIADVYHRTDGLRVD